MSTATPSDVQGVIETDLTTSEIKNYLDDAAFEAAQANSGYSGWTTEEKTQLEKYYAALKIRSLRDKAIGSTSRETASVNYEGGDNLTTNQLRQEVDRRDPSGKLANIRDESRYVGST